MATSVTTDLVTHYDLPPSPYFRRANYLRSNFDEGIVRTKAGSRVIILPQELVQGVHQAIEYETGKAWNLVVYLCGRRWGERLLGSVRQEWRQFHHTSVDHIDFSVVQRWLREYFAFHGWGHLEVDFSREDDGLVLFSLQDSVLDRLLSNLSGGYVNEIFCGLLAAWVSWFASAELECIEVESPQHGADKALLAVGIRDRIEAARKARARGGDPSDIWNALGEHRR